MVPSVVVFQSKLGESIVMPFIKHLTFNLFLIFEFGSTSVQMIYFNYLGSKVPTQNDMVFLIHTS